MHWQNNETETLGLHSQVYSALSLISKSLAGSGWGEHGRAFISCCRTIGAPLDQIPVQGRLVAYLSPKRFRDLYDLSDIMKPENLQVSNGRSMVWHLEKKQSTYYHSICPTSSYFCSLSHPPHCRGRGITPSSSLWSLMYLNVSPYGFPWTDLKNRLNLQGTSTVRDWPLSAPLADSYPSAKPWSCASKYPIVCQ